LSAGEIKKPAGKPQPRIFYPQAIARGGFYLDRAGKIVLCAEKLWPERAIFSFIQVFEAPKGPTRRNIFGPPPSAAW